MPKLEKLNSILLIDDDTNVNFLNEKILKRVGINVFTKSFSGALEALVFLENGYAGSDTYPLPGIIFLDLNMPVMNGWKFMEHYGRFPEEMRKHTKVIILSSSVDKEDIVRAAKDNNISLFMSKPLLKESLMIVINEYFMAY